jgi:hypothetical protein
MLCTSLFSVLPFCICNESEQGQELEGDDMECQGD